MQQIVNALKGMNPESSQAQREDRPETSVRSTVNNLAFQREIKVISQNLLEAERSSGEDGRADLAEVVETIDGFIKGGGLSNANTAIALGLSAVAKDIEGDSAAASSLMREARIFDDLSSRRKSQISRERVGEDQLPSVLKKALSEFRISAELSA